MSFFRRLTVPAFLLFFCLVGCRSSPPTETMELRMYEVPKGSAGSILNTFNSIMWVGENTPRVARAAVTPDGKLAVLATPSVHTGIAQLVEEVTKHPPPSDQAVELHYFLVVAKPASSPQPYPPNTAEIKSALDE